jgi:uncharacterized delta-60 repeat protein
MKIRTALLLIPVLLALCVGTAVAKPPPQRSGVDPTFGHGGTIAVSIPQGSVDGKPIQMATAPSGKSYVLAGSLLLAFRADGHPDPGFGHNGRIAIAAAAGETTEVTGLAVDSQGRVLVSGSVNPTPGVANEAIPPESAFALNHPAPSNAFVVRYLPDGERDPAFGGTGEIDVTLTPPARSGSPRESAHFEHLVVHADRLAVVNGETPVLGGSYLYYVDYCYFTGVQSYAFAAAIDPAGLATQSIAPTGYTQFQQSDVTDFAPMPGSNLAVLSNGSGACSNRGSIELPTLSALSFGSSPAPALDPARPRPSLGALAVDARGRFLGLEGTAVFPFDGTTPPWKLVRLLPNGDFDPGFGSAGGVPLKKFGDESVGGVVVGANERAVVAGGETRFRLVRFGTKGKIDHSFGSHGWVEVGFGKGSKASPAALTVDAKGRLLAAGRVTSPTLKTGEGIGLTRILTN